MPINGTNLNDTLNGTSAADTIYGLGGNDTISGGAGNDVIWGDSSLGAGVGPEILVTPNSPLWQTGSSVAGSSTGGFLVAYMSSPVSWHSSLAAQRNDQIIGRIYDGNGQATTGEFTINGAQTGHQNAPSATRLSDGNFLVVWTDESGLDGQQSGIFAQRVSPAGSLIGSQFQINQHAGQRQFDAHVTALPNGRFVVTYTTENKPGGQAFDTVVRSFDNAGGTPSAEVIVNAPSSLPGYQWDATVTAIGTSGAYAVTFQGFTSYNNSAGGYAYQGDVYVQRFNANGTANGALITVNPPHAEHDGHPVITGLQGGKFAVAWQLYNANASATEIYTQVFNANGAPSTTLPILTNTFTASDQNYPAIAALTGGGFVVVWQSFQQDGDNNGIYAQRFDASGAKAGNEFMVHQTVTAHQMHASVAATSTGGFVVSWDSGVYDLLQPNGMGVIRARMFDANGNAIGTGPADDSISGGLGNDKIYGGAGDDTVNGDGGKDSLFGGTGDDWLNGNADNDTVVGGAGNDVMEGNAGNDNLQGNAGDDEILGGTGKDKLTGGTGQDWLEGGTGDDSLLGEGGHDNLYGDDGNDTISGGGQNDTIEGGAHNDNLSGDAGFDLLKGGSGNDKIKGGAGNDILAGNLGHDSLQGDTGNDSLNGGSGNDRIVGGVGADTLTGGSGADRFIFAAAAHSGVGAAADRITDFVSGSDKIDLAPINGGSAFTFTSGTTVLDNTAYSSGAMKLRYVGGTLEAYVNNDAVVDFEIVLTGAPNLLITDFFL